MKNVVSAKTAEELKAQGFPQPLPAVGQTWYFETDLLGWQPFLVTHELFENDFRMIPIGFSVLTLNKKPHDPYCHFGDQGIFAPTSDDLLNALPPCYAATIPEKKWEVRAVSGTSFWSEIHELLVEAAAECWLAIKECKNEK